MSIADTPQERGPAKHCVCGRPLDRWELMVRRVQNPPAETLQYKHRDRRCGLFLQGAPKAPVISHHIKERDYKSKNGASTSGTIKSFVSMLADGPGCFVAECVSSVSH